MQVSEGMSPTVLAVGPGHSLRAVAQLMSRRAVGAAVVMDPDS
jgi:CBS domain-containing protein